jgi:hypothetical protein
MDVVAVRRIPILLSVTLGVEKEPTGREIIEGIRAKPFLGLDPNQSSMENTEDNFATVQTGAGLTVIGFANEADLRLGKTLPGDLLVAVGKPKVGGEVIPAEVHGEIADLRNVVALSQRRYVHDIVAVGASGIAHEARMMAFAVGRQLKLAEACGVDLEKSAGPASVVLVTLDAKRLEDLNALLQKPVTVVGEIL